LKGCVERVKAVHLIRVGGREERKKESWRAGEYLKFSLLSDHCYRLALSLSQYDPYNKGLAAGRRPPLPPSKETASNPVHRFTFLITNQTTTTQGMIDSLIQYLLEEIAMDGDEGKASSFSLVLVRVKTG